MPSDPRGSFAGRKVLITGGLGFIGSNLARRLVDLGAHVTVLDALLPAYGGRRFNLAGLEGRVAISLADLRDQPRLNDLVRGQAFIFNLAGQVSHLDSMRDPFTDLDVNCRSQLCLLEACRQFNPGVRLVYSGTRQVYGRPQYLPVDEQHPVDPVDINGVNKVAGEWYHLVYHRAYGLRTTALRLTNTYGPRMRVLDARQTFLGLWLRRVLEGQDLLVFGDGAQTRDLNYVDDVVEALLLAAASEAAIGESYNLGGDEVISLRDLAALLVELNGQGRYRLVPFPPEQQVIDIGDYYGSYARFQQALGWQPRITLRDGLARSLGYYRRHLTEYI